jgi:hypothetical protein
MALAVFLLFGSAGPAVAALDCNSNLTIGLPAMGISPGATFPVTLTVVNGVSTDAVDVDVAQSFQKITFWPSCVTTLPCVVDAALPLSFVGLVSTDCSVSDPWDFTSIAGGAQIECTFMGVSAPIPTP